jgi:hypothetical protein
MYSPQHPQTFSRGSAETPKQLGVCMVDQAKAKKE